jgi:hypothetical protein
MLDAHDHESRAEEDARIRNTLLGAIVVLILLGTAYWVVDEMMKSSKLQSCLEQGRRNCGPTTMISGSTRP